MGRGVKPGLQEFYSYITSLKVQGIVEMLLPEVELDDSTKRQKRDVILAEAPLFGAFQVRSDWAGFTQQALSVIQSSNVKSRERWRVINAHAQLEKSSGKASHQEKRKLVHVLRLRRSLPSIQDILDHSCDFEAAATAVWDQCGFQLILRERLYAQAEKLTYPGRRYHEYKRYCPLVEVRQEATSEKAVVCDEGDGFHIVKPDVSAVFVSSRPGGGFDIELAVIRDVPQSGEAYTAPLMAWLKATIIEACFSRRDVRPSHRGKMVQIGLNMGPRHARVLGWAKSFVRKLTPDEMVREDTNLIGAMSLLWTLIKAYIPADITGPVQALLDKNYPPLASQNIPASCGFAIEIDNIHYNFGTASRAPPEGIATSGYEAHTHTDECCTKWAFGWTVGRDIPPNCPLPVNMGSNFVDVGLKVVIQSAPGTLTAFQPKQLHGTTYTGGIINYGLAMNSTRRVHDAILDLNNKGIQVQYYLKTNTHTKAGG